MLDLLWVQRSHGQAVGFERACCFEIGKTIKKSAQINENLISAGAAYAHRNAYTYPCNPDIRRGN
jgi:hypothetical protein